MQQMTRTEHDWVMWERRAFPAGREAFHMPRLEGLRREGQGLDRFMEVEAVFFFANVGQIWIDLVHGKKDIYGNIYGHSRNTPQEQRSQPNPSMLV